MTKFKKIIYILLIMIVYMILIFIQISPKIIFKGMVKKIPVQNRVYIYSGKNIRISKVDDRYTGIISPNVVELSPGTHEIKAEYKKGRIKEEHYFEPYNYPAGTKVIVIAEKSDENNKMEFDLKAGEPDKERVNILEYIFYIISTLIMLTSVFIFVNQVKIIRAFERKIRDNEGALIKTTDDLYISRINGKKVNVNDLKVSFGKYVLNVVYSKKYDDSFFSKKTNIFFRDVEVEVAKNDVLEIGYLVENNKMRLDFKLNQE